MSEQALRSGIADLRAAIALIAAKIADLTSKIVVPDVTAEESAAIAAGAPLASQDAQLYAPRRGQLDDQGRLTPQVRPTQDDDQLEIPAFLRRQAN